MDEITKTAMQIWRFVNPKETTPPTEKELAAAKKYVQDAEIEVQASILELHKLRRTVNVRNP